MSNLTTNGVAISGMIGKGSIRHNNRSFSAANVDPERSKYNVIFLQEDLKKLYHQLFDEALASYNAGKKKTRDKIPDYYEHIKNSKQEKLFHEVIFQIGNLESCGSGTPEGDQAAAALSEFANSFQERNPHLRVFNAVLHMDEATPHLHIDFVPVATEQKRGLQTRVSLKQALKQQGFSGISRKQTEWAVWMDHEKQTLESIAKEHTFPVVSFGGGRKHLDLPEYKAAVQRLETVQEQASNVEKEIEMLEYQKLALKSTVKLLQDVEGVKLQLDKLQPKKTATGAVKGVSVNEVEDLKQIAIREAAKQHHIQQLENENKQLRKKIPSIQDQLATAREKQLLESKNRQLEIENEYLYQSLNEERGFVYLLQQGIYAALTFLEKILPEQWQPMLEKAWKLIPEKKQEPQQNQNKEWDWDMEL